MLTYLVVAQVRNGVLGEVHLFMFCCHRLTFVEPAIVVAALAVATGIQDWSICMLCKLMSSASKYQLACTGRPAVRE